MKDELLAGRYQLEQELGRGGMATVFLARDLRLARHVAVKVMHPGEDGRRAERFRREAELVASLKHPNVLEVHDFGEDAVRGPFLVCEWVQGESLRELARRLVPVPPEVTAVLGWELARALEAAHSRGVVHRDVKPENVLVSKGGPLKLADFGIAALAEQERLTSTGAITGSLPYMAPERIDTGAFSPATDVYSVGVILFELCTGTTPHAGRGSAHLAVSVMTRDAPPLTEAAPGTPEPLAALVDRCLARDSRQRPADGAELAACLEGVVGQLAGPPAEASRSFFQAPQASAARWREARFQRLLSEGRALLAKGEGARAARLLNEALTLRPGSSEVMALLRARPGGGRARVFAGSAVATGLLCALVAWGWTARREQPPEVATAEPGPALVPTRAGSSEEAPSPAPAPSPDPTGSVLTEPAKPQTPRASPPRRTVPARRPEASMPAGPDRQPAPLPSESTLPEPTRPASRGSTQPVPEPPPSEPRGHATLTVVTRPWAEVFVDGQSRGYTPRVRELRLSPGTHRLRFDNPLCDTVEEVIQVVPGEMVSREVNLQVRKAEVSLIAPAGARVFVDGVEVGVAPLRGPVKLGHGGHVVSARVASGDVLREEIDVVAGTRAEVVLGRER
jgi:serine/threonine-protein kinase